MQNIQFVQSVTSTVTFELSFPDEWTDQQILESLKDVTTNITAVILPETLPQGVIDNGITVDDITINSTTANKENA